MPFWDALRAGRGLVGGALTSRHYSRPDGPDLSGPTSSLCRMTTTDSTPDTQERADLLQFCTGSRCPPALGFASMLGDQVHAYMNTV